MKNGIIDKSIIAKEKTDSEKVKEEQILNEYEKSINEQIEGSREITEEKYNELLNKFNNLQEEVSKLKETIPSTKELNINYETKQANIIYTAETDGYAYLNSGGSPHLGRIEVYDEADNLLYRQGGYTSSITSDVYAFVYVPKGCKWKVQTDGTLTSVRWFKFE